MSRRDLVPLGLLIAALGLALALLPQFRDAGYLLESSSQYIETGLLALGVTFVIVSGNIDLSIASNLILTACLTSRLIEGGMGVVPGSLFGIACGTLLGAFNGLLVAKLRLPSFLVTLGTLAAYRGAAQALLGPNSVKLPTGFKGLDQSGMPGIWPLAIFLVIAVLAGFALHRTVFGRWVFAVGTNPSASRYAAVPNDCVVISVFAISGMMAGIGALLLSSRLGIIRANLMPGLELEAITVAVVGGAAITGGRGSMAGTALSLFLIMVMKTAMGVANVKAEYQLTAIGALLILAALGSRLFDSRARSA